MLTVREHAALQIADRLYLSAGLRDQAIKWELGWTPTRYWMVVDGLLERVEAEREYPVLVKRLRRLRERRAAARAPRPRQR